MLFFERYTTRLLRALSGIFSPVVRTSVTTIALVMASNHGAWAVTCPADVNGSYRTGWINATYGVGCNEVPATTGSPTVLNSNASWYVLAGSNLTVGADVITIGATNISYLGTNSFSLIGNQYLTHGSINFTDVSSSSRATLLLPVRLSTSRMAKSATFSPSRAVTWAITGICFSIRY